MNTNRAKLIAEIINHLEEMDAHSLKGEMAPPEVEMEVGMEGMEGPGVSEMGPDMMVAEKGTDPGSAMQDEELSDEELDELAKLG
jgi:hypothetical protein